MASFVDRNWLWSRFGLGFSLFLAVMIAALHLTPLPGLSAPAGLEKLYHFGAFMVLVFPVIVTDTNRWSWVVPAALVFGGAIEVTRPLLGSGADWLNFGASVSGVLAGAALAEILHNRIRRSVVGDEPGLRTDKPLVSEHDRLEAMRSDLMTELRTVLREELEAAAQRNAVPRDAAATVPDASASQPEAPQPSPASVTPSRAPDAVAPARVAPTAVRLKESAELKRARIALRAREHPYDPLTDARGAVVPKQPSQTLPNQRPPNTPPGDGASPRH